MECIGQTQHLKCLLVLFIVRLGSEYTLDLIQLIREGTHVKIVKPCKYLKGNTKG